MSASGPTAAALHDLRVLGEVALVVIVTWLLPGWTQARAITQMDGSQLVMPYVRGSLAAGPDWTAYLYRFGVLGGSEMHPRSSIAAASRDLMGSVRSAERRAVRAAPPGSRARPGGLPR